MKKLVLSAVAAAVLVGSVYTISADAAPDGSPGARQEHADYGFMLDAKLAGVHAALKLTPEQEKDWGPFETAVREAAKARAEARKAWRQERDGDERPSPVALMTQMSERLARASEEIRHVADAAKPLYDGLDDGQKRRFGPLVHMLREGHGPRGERGPRPL